MANNDPASRKVRVGVFLLVAGVVLIAAIFLLGRSQSIFSRKVILHTSFENTSGLVVGAPVRLAGVDIGIVQHIRFDRDLKVKNVHVTLGVESSYLDRIRADSIARLASKGLLGDMLINISVGGEDAAPLKDGDHLKSQETEGMTEIIASVQDAIGEVRTLTGTVDQRLRKVMTDELAHDVHRIAHSTADIIENVQKGDGLVHSLIYKPKMARQAEALLDDARGVAADVDQAIGRIDLMVAAVETGHGSLHDLIYKDDASKILTEGGRAAKSLADIINELQTGRGVLHSLVYEEDKTNLIQNLAAMSKILRSAAEEVQQGKGTIGALLKDPSVYEDLKTILGNIKRNRLLRALVRYTITTDELKDVGKVTP
jgi:phospholipid/cholesterol/gamma-HCH transport system substrate-binding protein